MENRHSEIIPRLYMKLLPIQIVLVIIGGVNAIIDNTFAGNILGAEAMAVTGLFGPVSNFLNAVNVLIFGGAQVLCGRYLGKQMPERTRSIFSLDLIAIVGISAALTAVLEITPGFFAGILGASPTLAGSLSSYIRGFAIGLPFFCLGTQFTAFLQLEHQEKRSYLAIILMFVCNTAGNWLFLVVFHMGLFGLGLATSVGNIVFFLIQAMYYVSGRAVLRFDRKCIILSDLPDILVNGFPGAATQLCIFIRGIAINHMISSYVGSDGLAAYSAISSFGCVYWAVPAGVTSAVIVLGSVYAGEEDRAGLQVLIKTFLKRGVGLVLFVSLALAACCYPLTNLFFHDPSAAVYSMTMMGFLLFPLSSPISAFVVGLSNYYHCLHLEGIVRIVSIMDGLIGVCIFTLLLIPRFGMNGLWVSQILGGLLTAAVLCAFPVFYKKGIPFSWEKMLCFPEDFGVPEENRIDISVHTIEETINISQKVGEFCRAHGINARRTNCASLCVEEMAGNTILHGFTKDHKKHSLDIRVSCVREDIIICLKDDGVVFDPTEAAKLFDPDDIAHNIGLRIATRISKSMTYQNTFGLNILTIVV